MRASKAYREAGVDTEAGAALVDRIKPLAQSTARTGSSPDLGAFGGLFDLAACGYEDPVLVAANDGVGTKLKVAIETGRHDTVGIDLVAMCANDLIVQGAEPLFFLDYFASAHLDVDAAEAVIAGIATGCRQAACALIGGETAEMPGMYAAGDYDLAGFCVGAVERARVLPRNDMRAGDALIGLPSSGFHSNGFSLIRKILNDHGLSYSDGTSFTGELSVGDALLEPTQIYVKPILAALRTTDGIKGLAHVTGGGLVENIPRMLPEALAADLDLSQVKQPPAMDWLSALAGLGNEDRLATFNCGLGMVLAVAHKQSASVIGALSDAGEAPVLVGELVPRTSAPVSFNKLPKSW
ncbi:MAG: phosphoribosylformylglycinamidine cyclo-ligase [Pseudomonadota bacterium]